MSTPHKTVIHLKVLILRFCDLHLRNHASAAGARRILQFLPDSEQHLPIGCNHKGSSMAQENGVLTVS
jgi:hypothetical protein